MQLHGKCELIPLTGEAQTSDRLFTAATSGHYRIAVHTDGPLCLACYDFVMQLFVSAHMPGDQDEPLRHSLISTENKSANWDDEVEQWMHEGDSVWLKACPCGGEHCPPVETSITHAEVNITRR